MPVTKTNSRSSNSKTAKAITHTAIRRGQMDLRGVAWLDGSLVLRFIEKQKEIETILSQKYAMNGAQLFMIQCDSSKLMSGALAYSNPEYL